jgi:hypothetical protein
MIPAYYQDPNAARVRQAAGSDQELTIQVSRCLWQCCGGGWRVRDYVQRYTGKILPVVTDDTFILTSRPLGKITSVLVEFQTLQEARLA